MLDDEAESTATALGDVAQPLRVAAVESGNRGAGGEPQHPAEAVRLGGVERHLAARGQFTGDVKARSDMLSQESLPESDARSDAFVEPSGERPKITA